MTQTKFQYARHADVWRSVADRTTDTDLAHDHDHVLRVYQWAVHIGSQEAIDADLCGAAALVHDLVNIPKELRERPLGGELSAVAGRELLEDAGYRAAEVETCVEAVRTSSWSRGLAPTNAVGVVLQDADRLDAIGAIGAARNFATAQAMAGRGTRSRLYDPADPLGRSGRPLDDVRNALDHWPIKLLKLCDGFHTETARAEARRRHAFLEAFLTQLETELGGACAGQ